VLSVGQVCCFVIALCGTLCSVEKALFQNLLVNICVLVKLLNAHHMSQMWFTDRSNVSTDSTMYKVVSKVQATVYRNSSQ
jgi:hypothetical protein